MHHLLAPILIAALTASDTPSRPAGTDEHGTSLKLMSIHGLFVCAARAPTEENVSKAAAAEQPYCGTDPWTIGKELHSRNIDAQLIRMFKAASLATRTVIVYALYHCEHPATSTFMDSIAFGAEYGPMEDEQVQWAKAYLLKKCDKRVLQEYSRRPYGIRGPPGGSYEYSFLVPYFGKCRYEPAIPYLLWLLDAVSGNVIQSAEEALRVFYPNELDFNSPGEAREYYAARYKAEPQPK